jgi:hypothetical protein
MTEEKALIEFNGRKFTKEELSDEQLSIVAELNVAQRALQKLQEAYEEYILISKLRDVQIENFSATLEEKKEEE